MSVEKGRRSMSRPVTSCLILESVVLTFAVVPGHDHDDQTSDHIERGEPRLLGLRLPLHRGWRVPYARLRAIDEGLQNQY